MLPVVFFLVRRYIYESIVAEILHKKQKKIP